MQKNHFFLGGFRKKCHICIRNPKGGIAQLARAPALQAGGRRFDSDYLHKKDLINRSGLFRFYSGFTIATYPPAEFRFTFIGFPALTVTVFLMTSVGFLPSDQYVMT